MMNYISNTEKYARSHIKQQKSALVTHKNTENTTNYIKSALPMFGCLIMLLYS